METDFEDNVDIDWEGQMEGYDSCYHWHSPEDGWAPA